MAHEEIRLTPAERRLLRRTFQRHALPYLGLAAALAVWALAGRPAAAPPPPEAGADLAQHPAFLALRQEVERALTASGGARSEQGAGAQAPQLAAVERRLEQTARRLDALEARLAVAGRPGAADPGGPLPGALLDRLFQLEQRQDGVEESRSSLQAEYARDQQRVLQRLFALEQRFEGLERRVAAVEPTGADAGALPAAPVN